MKKILFLGYSQKETKIIDKIKEDKTYQVFNTKNKIKLKNLDNINLVISFGYRHIISEDIIKKKKNMINLHISYLPYNKGAHPNFWSFAENTPSGVTVHKIDKGIDTGNIIYQKLLDFELNKNRRKLTFKKTYSRLISEIENLFIMNVKNILNNDYDEFKQIGSGSYHHSQELPSVLKSWDQNIFNTITKYQIEKNKNLNKKLELLNDIEKTRKNNNVNWMNILRHSIKKSPLETLRILNSINSDDDIISKLFKKLNEK